MRRASGRKPEEESSSGDKLLRRAQQVLDSVQGTPVAVQVTSVPGTERYFRERSGRANIGKAKRILREAGRGKAPMAGDEI
jgi:hypothetical protein